jgi:hypothetical protein
MGTGPDVFRRKIAGAPGSMCYGMTCFVDEISEASLLVEAEAERCGLGQTSDDM